jgi:hypothetical protein
MQIPYAALVSAPKNVPYNRDLMLQYYRDAVRILFDPDLRYDNHKVEDGVAVLTGITKVVQTHVGLEALRLAHLAAQRQTEVEIDDTESEASTSSALPSGVSDDVVPSDYDLAGEEEV